MTILKVESLNISTFTKDDIFINFDNINFVINSPGGISFAFKGGQQLNIEKTPMARISFEPIKENDLRIIAKQGLKSV